jgi:hypothetical protein
MRMSAGRIRSINRSIARTHAFAYTSRDSNARHQFDDATLTTSAIPAHTIRIVAVPKPLTV